MCVIRDRASASLLAHARPQPCNATHRLPEARAWANCHPASHKSTHPCGVFVVWESFSNNEVTSAAAVPPRKQAKPARERYTYQQPKGHRPAFPSSFGGARLRPSARTIAAGSGLVCAPPSLGAVSRVGVLFAAFSRAGLACFRGGTAAALQM